MAEEILIRINLQSGEAKAKVNEIKKATDLYSKSIDKLTKQQLKALVAEQKLNIQRQITKRNVQELALAEINAADAANKNRAQSGLNNAILLETGRLASDASFGFTAIANNLSQLVSLFQSFAKTNGGFIASFKELGRSLIGTGGILIALQLLISFGPKLLKFFKGTSGAVEDFKKKFDEATKAIEAQEVELNNYIDILGKANVPQKIRNNALKELEKVMPNIINLDKENKLSIDDLRKATENFIKQATLRAELEALLEANRDLFLKNEKNRQLEQKLLAAEDEDERRQILKDNIGFLDNLRATFTTTGVGEDGKGLLPRLLFGDDRNPVELFKRLSKATSDQFNQVVKDAAEIQEKLEEQITKRTGAGSKRRFREFQERLFDISKFKLKFDKDAAMLERRTRQELLDLDKEFSIKEAKRLLERFKEREEKRLEEFKERVKDAKNANVLIANAEKEFQSMMIDANTKFRDTLISIDEAYFVKKQKLSEKERQQVIASNRAIEDAEIGRLRKFTQFSDDIFNKKIEQLKIDNIVTGAIIAAAGEIGLSEAELAEKRKEFALTQIEIADLQLDKELATIERRKAINLEFVGFAQGISQFLTNIAGENEKVARAAFIIEKGAKIADVIIKTQAANAAARAQNVAALGTLTAVVEPLILRNNISAGISIATILAQKFGGGGAAGARAGGSASGAGSAPISVEAPDFNVVGESQVSQLAQSVSGQVTKPVKAFVVGKEITSQQELDRNINNTAGI